MHIHVMRGNGWEGLYIDRELWIERERLAAEDVTAAILDAAHVDYRITCSEDDQYISPESPFCPDILPKEYR